MALPSGKTRRSFAFLLSAVFLSGMIAAVSAEEADLAKGIQSYRQENYVQAADIFQRLHRQSPENIRITYYLAITQAQQGHFVQAGKLYREILLLSPQSHEALLAKQGLSFLPDEKMTDLDPPPKFLSPKAMAETPPEASTEAKNAQNAPVPLTTALSKGNTPVPMPQTPQYSGQNPSPYGNLSQQEMLALQALMGGGNNSGMNSGINPMLSPLMQPFMQPGTNAAYGQYPGMPNGAAAPAMDPQVFSSLLTNQLLQNMTLDDGNNSNR